MITIPIMKYSYSSPLLFLSVLLLSLTAQSQMITGVWKGKINNKKVEVKIIQQGDSLTGTSYYYESASHYRRYSIKGYYDGGTNEAVWWDDVLLESKQGRGLSQPGRVPLLARADFNCPGDGRMMLDGKAGRINEDPTGTVDLDKTETTSFPDEWDYVIDNYLSGTNDPDIIDSIAGLAVHRIPPVVQPEEKPAITMQTSGKATTPAPIPITPKPELEKPVITAPAIHIPAPTIEQKYVARKKVLTKEIVLQGDSIELRFYDNAEIDGDSISLFLNNKLLFSHIRLLGSAYTIKLAISELSESNELVMVAENLGSIPPNTSYMVALMGEERHEARLESTEGSSAMIRLVKKRE